MSGILYGIGTGPGDPELLTIKAVSIIRRTDVIAIPAEDEKRCLSYRTVMKLLPEIREKELLKLPFPMTGDVRDLSLRHRRYADRLKEYLDAETDVAFLTIGDPSVYSTYGYLHRILKEEGYPVQIISGIPSFCAAAASLGEILCERDETLEIIPASVSSAVLTDVLSRGGTKVFMKAPSKSGEIAWALRETGRSAAMVRNCTMPEEQIYRNAEEFPSDPGYFSIILSSSGKNSAFRSSQPGSSLRRPDGASDQEKKKHMQTGVISHE